MKSGERSPRGGVACANLRGQRAAGYAGNVTVKSHAARTSSHFPAGPVDGAGGGAGRWRKRPPARSAAAFASSSRSPKSQAEARDGTAGSGRVPPLRSGPGFARRRQRYRRCQRRRAPGAPGLASDPEDPRGRAGVSALRARIPHADRGVSVLRTSSRTAAARWRRNRRHGSPRARGSPRRGKKARPTVTPSSALRADASRTSHERRSAADIRVRDSRPQGRDAGAPASRPRERAGPWRGGGSAPLATAVSLPTAREARPGAQRRDTPIPGPSLSVPAPTTATRLRRRSRSASRRSA